MPEYKASPSQRGTSDQPFAINLRRSNRARNRRSERPTGGLLASSAYLLVPAPPWKQVGGEIGGRPSFARWTRGNRACVGVNGHHRAIEMPGGMAEQREDHGEPQEERQRAHDQ